MTTDDAWIREERAHERKMAEAAQNERRWQRQAMTERITNITIGVTVIMVVAIISFLVWRLIVNMSEQNTARDVACYESGGTRTQIGTGPTLCLHLGGEEVG